MAPINEALYLGFLNNGKIFKYDLTTLSKVDLAIRPVYWYYGCRGAWDGGCKIYIGGELNSYSHCSIYPYDIIQDSFGSELSNDGFTDDTEEGFSLVLDGFNRIYMGPGDTSYNYAYMIAEELWDRNGLANFPFVLDYGGQIIHIPMSATYSPGYLYAAAGNYSSSFYYIDPRNDSSWTVRAALPVSDRWAGSSWVGEYIYILGDNGALYRYDVNANSWSTMTPAPNSGGFYNSNNLATDMDPNGFLYAWNPSDKKIYYYDIDGDSWGTLVTFTDTFTSYYSFLTYVSQIRFEYLESDGVTHLDDPFAINDAEAGSPGSGVKRYLKALEAVSGVSIEVKSDTRGDDDDILEVAPDSGGSPGTWGASADLGSFSADQAKPFWLRANPADDESLGKRACKIEVAVS